MLQSFKLGCRLLCSDDVLLGILQRCVGSNDRLRRRRTAREGFDVRAGVCRQDARRPGEGLLSELPAVFRRQPPEDNELVVTRYANRLESRYDLDALVGERTIAN